MQPKIVETTPGGKEPLASREQIRPVSGTFQLGALVVPLALPPMLWRYRIVHAWGDEDPWSMAAIGAAIIGLCWGGPDAPEVSFAKHGRDVVSYGEVLYEVLLERGVTVKEMQNAANALIEVVADSLPRPEAIEAAAVPTGATKEPSTAPSSPSVSPGTGTPSPATASADPSSSA